MLVLSHKETQQMDRSLNLRKCLPFSSSIFVTLTYSNEFLPSPPSVSKRELQLFLKRLRKALGDKKIRYYACGEYGDTFLRPHYHLIIFGMGNTSEEVKLIEKIWNKGLIYVRNVLGIQNPTAGDKKLIELSNAVSNEKGYNLVPHPDGKSFEFGFSPESIAGQSVSEGLTGLVFGNWHLAKEGYFNMATRKKIEREAIKAGILKKGQTFNWEWSPYSYKLIPEKKGWLYKKLEKILGGE
ncbi:hypothetical protein LW137_00305 [Helicobacter sp. faydin-H23]|uniref:rolling circle replication-associated protein n=1 Tax=Helicobacter kayseriensis TaxID=2905877 RepID=UPI001E3DC04F|nr:hypothetical protein [Helicobacter kayseriensis]MCE3047900.1 hypothetical protein [Helicobacter kayseriensis]